MDAQEVMHMTDYSKITALYSRLSVGDEDRDGGESNSIQNQKIFLENYARGQHLTNIRHYIDDDESGRFFDRSAYSRMMDDVENGKIGVCIMKDLTRWGRDYLQVGNAMEIFRRNNVRFIAVNNGIDSEKPDTLEFAPFINIMSEWYAKDISKKVKTGIKTKGMSGKPIATEAPYGYVKSPDNKDFWIIDEEAAGVVRLIFRLFLDGKNRNQIAVYLTQAQIPTPTFYMKERGRGTCKNRALNEANRYKWNKATLTHILTRQEYCGDVINFKTYSKSYKNKKRYENDKENWAIFKDIHEPIIDRTVWEKIQERRSRRTRKKPVTGEDKNMFSGLLVCADCGSKLGYHFNQANHDITYFNCMGYNRGSRKICTSTHYIRTDFLEQVVLGEIKRLMKFATLYENEFAKIVMGNSIKTAEQERRSKQKELNSLLARDKELDLLFEKIYEDNTLGRISDDRFSKLSVKYETEQKENEVKINELQAELDNEQNRAVTSDMFLSSVRKYTRARKLTPRMLNELIDKIEVYQAEKIDGKKVQRLKIHYNCIGAIEIPDLSKLPENNVSVHTRQGVNVQYAALAV